MTSPNLATVPVRCVACGQQTHKTLDAIAQSGGLICDCGAFTEVDVATFEQEVLQSQTAIKDFGRDG